MFIINSIAPIFLLTALGVILRKTGFLPESFFKGINKLVFWIVLPALLINDIGAADLELPTIYRIMLLVTMGSIASLALAWIVARWMKLPPPSVGSFIQGSFRSNGAFIGLPVIVYSLGSLDSRAESLGIVALGAVTILYNILGVLVLLHYGRQHNSPAKNVLTFAKQLAGNPLILACVAGLLINASDVQPPLFIMRPIELLGRTALPLILMSIGASLEFERLRGAASPSLVASLIKTVAAPAFGFLFAGLVGLGSTERMIAIFYLAAPAAGMSYVMADVMGNDGPLAGRIVALSTVLSAITIPLVMIMGIQHG